MTDRLPTSLLVGALLRRVNDAGGLGVVRARGDAASGGILAVAGPGQATVFERGLGLDGGPVLIDSTPADGDIERYWRRRRDRDPDLWVVELDIPDSERFVAETILAV